MDSRALKRVDSKQPTIPGAVAEFILLAVLIGAVPAIASLDVEIFMHGSSELSATELSQEALILMAAAVFALRALRQPADRAWLVLVAGLFACMFIREIDMWLDRIAHGFWVYPASLTALSAGGYAALNRRQLKPAMLAYAATRAHAYIATGLLVIILFSRVFGGSAFLQAILADAYDPAFKTLIQEGIELLGYALVAFGSGLYVLMKDGRR